MSVTPDDATRRDALRALAAASPAVRVSELLRAMADRFRHPVSVLYVAGLDLSWSEAESKATSLLRRLVGEEVDAGLLGQCRGSIRHYLFRVAAKELPIPPSENARNAYQHAWCRCLFEDALGVVEEEARLSGRPDPYDAFLKYHVASEHLTAPAPSALMEGREAFWRALEMVILGTLGSEDLFVDEVTELFGR